MRGEMTLQEGLLEGFEKFEPSLKEKFVAPMKEASEEAKALSESLRGQLGGMSQAFDQFLFNRKVRDAFRQLFRPVDDEKPAAAFKLDQIKDSAETAKKAIEDLNAVRFGGIEFRRLLRDQAFNLRSTSGAGGDVSSKTSEQLLRQISNHTAEVLNRGFTIVAEANF